MASTSAETTTATSPPRENRPAKRKLSESTEHDTKECKTESEPVSKKTKVISSASSSTAGDTSTSFEGRKILFVTGNKGKLAEVQEFLGTDLGKHVVNEKINLLEIQGKAEEILRAKLEEAAETVEKKVESEHFDGILVEDTNLCLNAYGGMPGPYIKDFLSLGGRQGLIDMAKCKEDKSAMAVCLFGFIDLTSDSIGGGDSGSGGGTRKISIFRGQCAGEIADKIKGESGFGWDPVFIPREDGCDGRSFAEMTMAEKNKVSHRAKAMDQLKPFIEGFIAAGNTDAARNIAQAKKSVAGASDATDTTTSTATAASTDVSSNSNSNASNNSGNPPGNQ